MSALPIADVIEIEQLLARYAVGDDQGRRRGGHGGLHPRRHLQRLRRHLPPGRLPDAGRRRAEGPVPGRAAGCSTSTATRAPGSSRSASSSRRPTTCASATTPTPTAAPTDGWRLHTRSMTFLRKSGAQDSRPAARPDPARSRTDALTVTEDRTPPWSSTSSGRSLDAWLDENDDAPAAGPRRARHARPADGPALQGQAADLRRRVDAAGLARAGRRARGLDAAAGLPRRGARRPGTSSSPASTR